MLDFRVSRVRKRQPFAIIGASMNAERHAADATQAEDSAQGRIDPQHPACNRPALEQGAHHPAQSSLAELYALDIAYLYQDKVSN